MKGKRPSSPRGQIALGLMVMAAGLSVAALTASRLGALPDKLELDALAGVAGGLSFVFGGAILVVPERFTGTRAFAGALMVTSFALLYDWAAFGPGERLLHGGAPLLHRSVASPLSEMSGRILFAVGAVLFNLLALWAWVRARKVAGRKPGRVASRRA
jgi:hypothetical protein